VKEICKQSFLYSLGVGFYIVLVALFMNRANSLLGPVDTVYTGITALLLFAMSALIVGGLLVGKPIFLYIDGKKKEAIKMLLANAGWLLLFFIIAVIILAITK